MRITDLGKKKGSVYLYSLGVLEMTPIFKANLVYRNKVHSGFKNDLLTGKGIAVCQP